MRGPGAGLGLRRAAASDCTPTWSRKVSVCAPVGQSRDRAGGACTSQLHATGDISPGILAQPTQAPPPPL